MTLTHSLKRPRPARGADLIGSYGAMILFFTVLGIAIAMMAQSSKERDHETVARQATTWANAAKLYIAANYDQLLATAPATISYNQLVNSGYLNSGEPATNLYLQTWGVAVRVSPKNNKVLDAVLLSTGGDSLEYSDLRYISSAINGSGGFVYSGSMPAGCTNSTTVINGAACSWTQDLTGFGISTTTGHIAVNLGADILGTANAGNDFLHRFSTPGREEYNQMNTALDMNGMNLNRAGNLVIASDGKNGDDHGSNGSRGFLGWASGSSDGAASDGKNLRTGLYFSTAAPSADDKESVWIKTTDNTSLEVKGKVLAPTVKGSRLLQSSGYLMPGKIVTAGSACDPVSLGISDLLANTNGLVAHDSTGATLSCQSGAWKTQAPRGGQYVLRKYWPGGEPVPENQVLCQANPVTGGCNCPVGATDTAYMTGQTNLFKPWDTYFEIHFCVL